MNIFFTHGSGFIGSAAISSYLQHYLDYSGVQTLISHLILPNEQQKYSKWNEISYYISEKIYKEVLSIHIKPTIIFDDVNKAIKLCNNSKL